MEIEKRKLYRALKKKSFTIVIQMLLRGEFYENATLKGVQSVHRSTP
jgi:hypothetical protein